MIRHVAGGGGGGEQGTDCPPQNFTLPPQIILVERHFLQNFMQHTHVQYLPTEVESLRMSLASWTF